MDPKARIALLIDADNVSARRIDLILNELSGYGETSIRRAYGNWTKPELRGWAGVLHENAIRPMQQYDYSSGKNASDMALVVDAMALLYTDRPEAYAIVSSDGDFTPLVMHLREKGAAVYGFGERKTPEPFKSACSRFLVLDQLDVDEEPTTTGGDTEEADSQTARLRVPTAELKQDAKLVSLLRRAVQGAADDDGWALVGNVGQHIANQSSFDPRNYGYAKLSKLLEACGLFDMKDEGTSALAVRDKRLGKGSKR
ncbi:OST-HTH/LOTUS domain-containing protein [Pedococcus cremeus]|uniref:OST-HTH/LOTUS domain-containing protein n=1 Tax=Pedococcus cremeus TaxID=587636 RepID=A0A1H9XGH5_9MICO|nr:NYN domain-containing protein [Pedococcus cremeus]SES45242.1 OST-HTH/LOTUS domain-containing protein [Pedococcus cremeus]